MAEWTKAPVLKTGDGKPSVGSNPTPSANMNRCAPGYDWLRRGNQNREHNMGIEYFVYILQEPG